MLADPLPASIKDLAQIVGSITADATRAEKRSVILQEQVEDLHARWEEAGAVIGGGDGAVVQAGEMPAPSAVA